MIRTLVRLLRFAWPHRRRFYLSVVFALGVAILWSATLLLTFPVVKILKGESLAEYVEGKIQAAQGGNSPFTAGWWGWIRDRVVPLLPADAFTLLAGMLGLLLLVTILKGVLRIVQEILVAGVVERTVMDVRRDCFHGALGRDYHSLVANGTSDMMSRFTHDLHEVHETLKLFGIRVVREPLKALACLGCALAVNWRLTLLSLVFVPVGVIVFGRLGNLLKRASRRTMQAMARIYSVLEECYRSIKVVIAFDRGEKHNERFREEHDAYYRRAMTIARIEAVLAPITELIGILAVCALMLPGAYLVLRQVTDIWGIRLAPAVIDLEELAVMYTLLAGMIDPARRLSGIYSRTRKGCVAADRVFQLVDGETTIRDPDDPKTLPRHCESITFSDVRFTYRNPDPEAPQRPPALDGVDLEVVAGECIAIVGENGSGKSTLVNLLPRFFDPDSGTVLVDGIDTRDVALAELRGQIGVVTQETLLFDATIAENIRYGKPDATYGEVVDAARRADMLDFVEQLPNGFDTVVGEGGNALSGGQRQRLALARAIVRNPAILLLDEATSAVDAESTKALHELLAGFTRDRTTFVVTHSVSPSLLAFVTRIVVMDRGRIVAVGEHEALLATCPVYCRLFDGRSDRIGA